MRHRYVYTRPYEYTEEDLPTFDADKEGTWIPWRSVLYLAYIFLRATEAIFLIRFFSLLLTTQHLAGWTYLPFPLLSIFSALMYIVARHKFSWKYQVLFKSEIWINMSLVVVHYGMTLMH